MTPTTRQRATRALAKRLEELLPDGAAKPDDQGYTARLDDVLLPTLTETDRARVRHRLEQADGNELGGDRPSALAAHSSAMAAANLFGVWTDRDGPSAIGPLSGFDSPLVLERKLPFQRGGTPPNLDAVATGRDIFVGIESKLTEPLTKHPPRPWQESISRSHNLELLDGGWRELLELAVAGSFSTNRLESAQLLRHALGVARNAPAVGTVAVVYAYWEPTNAEDFDEFASHREELEQFSSRVAGASLGFHAITHSEIVRRWDTTPAPAWLKEHCAAWRQRYDIAI